MNWYLVLVAVLLVAGVIYYMPKKTSSVPASGASAEPAESGSGFVCPKTGGAGLCNSLSEYYDPAWGKCMSRPKMFEGYSIGETADEICDSPTRRRTRWGSYVVE